MCGLRRAGALCRLLAAAAALCTVSVTVAAAPPAIALLDCVVIDDNAAYNDASVTQSQQARAAMASTELRARIDQRGLYKVADNRPAAALIDGFTKTQDLSACNGCELEIGRKLGVQRVGVCWVQKISNLILNINLRIEDTANGQVVFQRSVDIRGNTDQSWRRGVAASMHSSGCSRQNRKPRIEPHASIDFGKNSRPSMLSSRRAMR
jgi:hypothetical protein